MNITVISVSLKDINIVYIILNVDFQRAVIHIVTAARTGDSRRVTLTLAAPTSTVASAVPVHLPSSATGGSASDQVIQLFPLTLGII